MGNCDWRFIRVLAVPFGRYWGLAPPAHSFCVSRQGDYEDEVYAAVPDDEGLKTGARSDEPDHLYQIDGGGVINVLEAPAA